jgi:predicted ATPase
LVAELGRRGHAAVEEPGRRIVKEELANDGPALPWVDRIAFARRAITDGPCRSSSSVFAGWLFFDRGLLDAAAALQHRTGELALATLGQANRYHRRVFLTPPWPEIYRTDPERRHGMDMALAEYSRLLQSYPSLGYAVSILPNVGVEERCDFILRTLDT